MSLTGKSSLSLKKKELINDKPIAVGFKALKFAHIAALDDAGFNIYAMTVPTQLSSRGFLQPTASELSSADIYKYRKNLILMSSARGVMFDYLDYTVSSSGQITFSDDFGPALENEIFIGVLDPVARSGTLVADTNSILQVGVLSAGTTDFSIGKSFTTNKNPSQQMGAVEVQLDGQTVLRNVGNAAASPSADGDYEEVDNGAGECSLIRFNVVDNVNDRVVIVKSTVLSTVTPDGSFQDELEYQQGIIDRLVETVAALAGIPQSNLQSAPSQPQLKQFGDRVVQAEQDIDSAEARLDDLEDPTQMSDILATKLGYKHYEHGGSYNGGNAPTITISTGAASVSASKFIPYQMQDGSWRMRFNFSVRSGTVSTVQGTISIAGVVFSNESSTFRQSVTVYIYNSSSSLDSQANVNYYMCDPGTGNIFVQRNGSNWNHCDVSGDVALESKPTWAY